MPRRTVSIPGIYDIEIDPILPVIDHVIFRKLQFRRQLGTSFFTFPCANHQRFEHALATYSLTKERADRWARQGAITSQEAWDLALFGLLHDVGHGPYSHLAEALCEQDHNEHGIGLLHELRDPIEQCGGDVSRITKVFTRSHPLSAAVSHHPLGTDKLDYLSRDARYTSEAVSLTMGALLNYVHYMDDQLVIDSGIIHEVMQAQRFYVYMYDRVYWKKSCLITQRFLQKIVGIILHHQELSQNKLARLTDSELDALLFNSKVDLARELFRRFLERRFPKVAIALYPDGSPVGERIAGKPISVHRLTTQQSATLDCLQQATTLQRVESEIAALIGLPSEAVVITPRRSAHRFLLPDIPVYEQSRWVGNLQQLCPEHYASLAARSQTAIRICVFEEHRARVASALIAKKVVDYLISQINPVSTPL